MENNWEESYEEDGVTLGPEEALLRETEKTKALNSLSYLKKKMDKADKQRYEVEVQQIRNLIETVFPSGIFQERHESLLSLLVRYDYEIIKYLINMEQYVVLLLSFNFTA